MKNETIGHGNQVIVFIEDTLSLEVIVSKDEFTVWLSQKQIAELFQKDRKTITRHIQNIFTEGELIEKTVCSNFEHTASDGKNYIVKYYNLDVIISVGYRVKSATGIKFRRWATSILKKHLIEGYTLNKERLISMQEKFLDLQKTIDFLGGKLQRVALSGQEGEIFRLLQGYSRSLTFLEQYDKNRLPVLRGNKSHWILTSREAKDVIQVIKKELILKKEATELFGQEGQNTLDGIIGNLYQTFGGEELYPSIETKASHLISFILG